MKQLSSKKIIGDLDKDSFSENLTESSVEDNIDEDEEFQEKNQSQTKVTFFARPYLTFCLSEHSKDIFEKNVNRQKIQSKYDELINNSDHFLFEMLVNYHMIQHSPFLQFLASINYFYVFQ